jgi:hypothetical protein
MVNVDGTPRSRKQAQSESEAEIGLGGGVEIPKRQGVEISAFLRI